MTPPDEYHPGPTGLPSPREVLTGEREPLPIWLRDYEQFDKDALRNFLSSRTVHYPGSGTDGHAIK